MRKFVLPTMLLSAAAALCIGAVGGNFSSTVTGNSIAVGTGLWEKPLVINEVYYDTGSREYPEGDKKVSEKEGLNEWVEIYNPNFYSVNVKGYTVGDYGEAFTIGSETHIPPKGYLVLTHSDDTWRFWPEHNMVMLNLEGKSGSVWLDNDGEWAYLKDANGKLVDQIGYGSSVVAFDPSCKKVAPGHSLERRSPGLDTGTASDFVDKEQPTPGY